MANGMDTEDEVSVDGYCQKDMCSGKSRMECQQTCK